MLHKKGNFKKGIYRPKNREKYSGVNHPKYKSSWELHFYKWCDNNSNVIKWAAESVVIPYVSPIDNKVHRYYIDIILTLREHNKNVKYIVEIKPYIQTIPPKHGKSKKSSTLLHEKVTYSVNQAKWKAAREWAENNNYKFLLITERELFNK